MEDNNDLKPPAFFDDPDNLRELARFRDLLKLISLEDRPEPDVVDPLSTIIVAMIRSRADFDKNCRINIAWIGGQFISRISGFERTSANERKHALHSIFTMAYRFVKEFEFSLATGYELGPELTRVRSFVFDNLEKFGKGHLSDLMFAEYMMPASLLKELSQNPALAEFKAFHAIVDKAAKLKSDWDGELEAKQQHLDALSDKIDKLKTKYNFVALSKGFQDLLEQKRKDLRNSFTATIFLGVVMLLPVAAYVFFAATHIDQIDLHKSTLMYVLPSILTLEILLFYFFRVALTHYNSLKAQILQLDLRVSLCQFIESYAEYAKRIRTDDKSALDRFEQLIFSGLVASEGDIPSTFDGVEQIGKILSALKGKE